MVDVDGVDFVDLGPADADTACGGANAALGVYALLDIELLRVVDAVQLGVRRENHSRRNHGTGQRPHADLVDARDVLDAGAPQHALEIEHCVEPRAFGAVAVVAPLERRVDQSHAVSRVALELAERLRADGRIRARVPLADLVDRQFQQLRRHGWQFSDLGAAT